MSDVMGLELRQTKNEHKTEIQPKINELKEKSGKNRVVYLGMQIGSWR